MLTVITPTLLMARRDLLTYMLSMYETLPIIEKVLIIDNTPKKICKAELGEAFKKLTVISNQKNLYVNPAWNYGISLTTTKNYLIINDDLACAADTITVCHEKLTKDRTAETVCVHPYVNDATKDEPLDKFFELRNSMLRQPPEFHPGGCGCFIMGRTNEYTKIDERMKIGYGDNILVTDMAKHRGRTSYILVSDMALHLHQSTSKHTENKNSIAWANRPYQWYDAEIYHEWLKTLRKK